MTAPIDANVPLPKPSSPPRGAMEDRSESPDAPDMTFEDFLQSGESFQAPTQQDAPVELPVTTPAEGVADMSLPTLALANSTSSFAALGVLISRELAASAHVIPEDGANTLSVSTPEAVQSGGDAILLDPASALDPRSLVQTRAEISVVTRTSAIPQISIGRSARASGLTAPISRMPAGAMPASLSRGLNGPRADAAPSRDTQPISQDARLSRLLSEGANNTVDVKVMRGETGLVLLLGLPSGDVGADKALERRLTRLVEAMGERVERIEYRTIPSRPTDPNTGIFTLEEDS